MYSVALNDTNLKEIPVGFENLACSRKVSDRYHGFLKRKTAFVDAGSDAMPQLTFTEPAAVKLLVSAYQEFKFQARVSFSVFWGGEEVFKALINFESATFDKHSFSCSTKDDDTISTFISKDETTYSITPTERCLLFSKNIENQIRYSIPEERRSIRKKTKTAIRPFKLSFRSESELDSLEDKAYYYINDTEKPQVIELSGVVKGYFTGFGTVTIDIYGQQTTVLAKSTNSTSAETLSLTIFHRFSLNAGEGFYIRMSALNKTDITAELSEGTYFNLSVLASYPNSYATGLTAKNLLTRLLARINPSLSLNITPSLESKLEKIFITSGKNIRGYLTPFNASYAELFEALDVMLAIRQDIKDDVVYLSEYISTRSSLSISEGKIRNITYSPAAELAFPSITFGFANWKSESFLGSLEYNSVREYESGIIGGSKMNKRSSIIGSGQIIEAIRKQQYLDSDNRNKDNKHDDDLFAISCVSVSTNTYHQSGAENYSDGTGIIDIGGKPTNLDLMPERLIKNWIPQLKASTNALNFVSGEGNYTATTKAKTETSAISGDQDFDTTQFVGLSGFFCEIEFESTIGEYVSLPDVLEFTDGFEQKRLLVQSVSMPFDTREPIAVVEGYLLD